MRSSRSLKVAAVISAAAVLAALAAILIASGGRTGGLAPRARPSADETPVSRPSPGIYFTEDGVAVLTDNTSRVPRRQASTILTLPPTVGPEDVSDLVALSAGRVVMLTDRNEAYSVGRGRIIRLGRATSVMDSGNGRSVIVARRDRADRLIVRHVTAGGTRRYDAVRLPAGSQPLAAEGTRVTILRPSRRVMVIDIATKDRTVGPAAAGDPLAADGGIVVFDGSCPESGCPWEVLNVRTGKVRPLFSASDAISAPRFVEVAASPMRMAVFPMRMAVIARSEDWLVFTLRTSGPVSPAWSALQILDRRPYGLLYDSAGHIVVRVKNELIVIDEESGRAKSVTLHGNVTHIDTT